MNKVAFLKCRFCGWSCLKWKRNKKGKLISTPETAFQKLKHHIEFRHPEELEKVRKLEEEFYETNNESTVS